MQTPFRVLAELCEKLEATKKRLAKLDLASSFLIALDANEVEPAVSMILGKPLPKGSQSTLEISWSTVNGILEQMIGVESRDFAEAWGKTGDVGSMVKMLLEGRKVKRQTALVERAFTLMEVRRSFEEIAEARGQGSRERKERLIEALLSQASPLDAKYLIRILIGEVRTGFNEGLMGQAVAKAFQVPIDAVRRASMTLGDVGEAAAICKREGCEGLTRVGFSVFRPVSLMLAQMANSVAEALKEHGGKTAFEYKYDGARVQIHKSSSKVRIFSRRLADATESLPEIVEIAKANVEASEAILEGEVVAVDDQGSPIPFQHLMRRFKRIHAIEATAEEVPIKLYLFDILYLDGKSVLSEPYLSRRQALAKTAGKIELTKQLITGIASEAEDFLKEAVDAGHEGVMAKSLDGAYTPGVRGKRWLKIKPVLDPLDLVIIAAEYGYGRRLGWLSDYSLAARDAESGEFLAIGKTFKGLDDAEIVEMTKRLHDLSVGEDHGTVAVAPKVVVEVAYNEIQKSPKYKSGMALRFARITRIREDKTPAEADTIQRVKQIYDQQFQRKGRYKNQ